MLRCSNLLYRCTALPKTIQAKVDCAHTHATVCTDGLITDDQNEKNTELAVRACRGPCLQCPTRFSVLFEATRNQRVLLPRSTAPIAISYVSIIDSQVVI